MLQPGRPPLAETPVARRCAILLAALLALVALSQAAWPAYAVTGPAAGENPIYLPLVRGTSPVVPGLPFDPFATRSGQATFYDADGGGNCSFDPSPSDLMVGAMNQIDYRNSLICGAYLQVNGPKGTIVIRVVDRCPECPEGNIDLSREAFAQIADLADGRVPITWRLVSPALGGPIIYRFKDGSSKWWLAVQIRHHRNPIWKVEFRDTDGMFKSLERQEYNYFVEPADRPAGDPVPESLTLRVIDIYGHMLTDSGIPLVAESSTPGSAQFPPMP
jgi:expansin (peptidoglycan-binding protein)